jgi:hypothetical protein
MEDFQKAQDEIKEFVKTKIGNKTYMLSILVDEESAKEANSVREIRIIYDSNLNPQKQTFNEVNSFVVALDQLARNIRSQIVPRMPRIEIK